MASPSTPLPARRSLRAGRRGVWLATGVLVLQFTLGLLGTLTPRGEIFPFASWFLFSLVPDRVVSYDLLLHGTARRPLDPPRAFNQAGGWVKSPHSVTVYQLTQQLGRAFEAGRAAETTRVRREIEAQFSAPGMRYDLVRVSYRLAERWKNRQAPQTVTLTRFGEPGGGEP